jgi:F-type H+-transporting ATPase subunit b
LARLSLIKPPCKKRSSDKDMPTADITAVYQIIGYLVLFAVFHFFLIKPLLRVMKERDEKTSGALKRAEAAERDISEGMAEYEKRLREAVQKGRDEIKRIKAEWAEKEKALLEDARRESEKELTGIKGSIEAGKVQALQGLKSEAKAISKAIAEKLIERRVMVLLLGLTLLAPAISLASGGGEGNEGGGSKEMLWKSINFTVLIIALVLIWKKAISKVLAKRSSEIEKALGDAKAAKDAAEKKTEEYRERLGLLEARITQIQADMKREAEAERERLKKDAEAQVAKIREQARISAEQAMDKARLELRGEAASLAVAMAEDILKRELNPEDHQRLIRGTIKNLRLN